MVKVQIIYQAGINSKNIHPAFEEEAEALRKVGFLVGTSNNPDAELTLYRGCMKSTMEMYPMYPNMLQAWEANRDTLFISRYFPVIENLSFPTFFVDNLDEQQIANEVAKRKWNKAFIKSDAKSLFAFSEITSVWPDTSIAIMKDLYEKCHLTGPFAIRQFIDNKQIFYNEQRYWVLNGTAHHPSGFIPRIVVEAAERIYKFSGSHYFTLDVAGDYIVEVNPGESSDRGGDNPLDFFCQIFAETFLKNRN